MRMTPVLAGFVLALGLSACSGMQSEDAPDRIQLTGLEVTDPKVGTRYPTLLSYEAKGDVSVIDSCFIWSDKDADFTSYRSTTWFGDGPYCFGPEADAAPGLVRSMAVTGYPGTYELEGFVRYKAGGVMYETNRVSTEITVAPR